MATYLEMQKEGLVKKLFNQEILTRTDVTTAKLARIAGVSNQHFYRWYEKFGFKPKKNFANDLSEKEIADKVWNTLTLSQGQRLYEWAKSQRFDRKKEPEKRAYTFTKAGRKGRKINRKRTKKDAKREEATSAKLVNSVVSVEEVPTATKEKIKNISTAEYLHDFTSTSDSTALQVDNLLSVLLFDDKPNDLTVKSVANKAKDDKSFNYRQWAFNEMYHRAGREAQDNLKKVLAGELTTEQINSVTAKLFKAYNQNKNAIKIEEIK